MLHLNTFSIAARCPRTGMLGVAISTAVPAVGSLAVYVKANTGAVASQAWINPYLGIDSISLLSSGLSATATVEQVIGADPGYEHRQLAVVDANGAVSAFTGSACPTWSGHIEGNGFSIQGNLLSSGTVIEDMARTAQNTEHLDLPERLMRVLEAGQAAGGDRRGKQSAAVKIVHREEYPWVDLRVDEHAEPVAELRRVFELAKVQLFPFTAGLPSRSNPLGYASPEIVEVLMKAPPDRPKGRRD
jgi:uncharacterized Ntn-hydrolase superfamily protein